MQQKHELLVDVPHLMCQKRRGAFVVTNCHFVSCAVDVMLHITYV